MGGPARFEGRLGGRVAVVLGGGADGPPRPGETLAMGNGRAIALRLAAEGATVVVVDRDLASATVTAEHCGDDALAVELDLADLERCCVVAAEVLERVGSVDVVVANAAISGHDGLRTQQLDEWERTMAVNVTGQWCFAQVVLPSMIERGRGSFVFVGSTAAIASSGRSLSYEASKAAQLAVMRHVAVRYGGHGIRSNAVVLGVIDSTMVRREFGDASEIAAARDSVGPMRRQGTSEEAAGAAVFLASDDASYVNGHCLVVDGGVTASWPSPPVVRPPSEKGK